MVLRKLGKILLYAGAGTVGVVLLLLLAVKLALDRVPDYQAEIQEWVRGRIGYHIAFASVSPAFRWYGPELYFDRLELRSKDDRRVLARAAGGRIGLDVWELIRSGKLFAGRIELDAPNISITRTGPHEFALAPEIALGLEAGDAPLPPLTLDDLPKGTLAIRAGLITVRQWNPALPELELRGVDLDLRRGDGVAALAVVAHLPAVLGGELSVNAAVRGAGRLDTLDWTAVARTHNLALGGLRQLLPEFLGRLGAGKGGFELAARGRGAVLRRADLDFDATDVTTQLVDEPAVKFDQIAGALTITHSGDRWTLLGRRMRALSAGRRDPPSEFDVSWRGDDAGLLELRARASYLRAETLLPLAGLLPQKDLRERLQEIEPTGEWFDTHMSMTRSDTGAPWHLDVQARFRGIGFAAVGRAPGLRGLNGTIAGTDGGGHVDIEGDHAVFSWPAQLPQAVPLDVFKTTLYWRRTPQELLVATPSIDFRNRDGEVSGRFAWLQPSDGDSPVLTVAASVDDGNAADTNLYLPRELLAPPALAWLNRAFVAGHLSHADLRIQGPIRHFPFRDGSGLLLARAHLEGMTLDCWEGWPRVEGLDFLAEFRNEGMRAQLHAAHIGGLVLEKGDLRFADFKNAELLLHVSGSADAADALDYLRATPLDALSGNVFSSAEARGPIQADIDLDLPFKDFDQRRTLVHAHLHGVSLNHRGSSLAATELNGDADVDGSQVVHADVRGKLLGGTFQMQARAPRAVPATRTRLVFNGTVSGDAIHSALSLPASIPITGTTDWHGVLRIASEPARERSLRLSGSLNGLDIKLPEPLAKPAGRPLLSSAEVLWPLAGGLQIRAALGSVVHGHVTLDEDDAGALSLGRAALTFGPASEPPDSSDAQVVNIGGTIDRLDLGGWLRLYTPDRSAKPLDNFLRSAQFNVGEIDYLGLSFHEVSVDLTAAETGWRLGIGGPNVVGSILLPGALDSKEPWQVQFQRLRFADGAGFGEPERADSSADAYAAAGAAASGATASGVAALGATATGAPAAGGTAADVTAAGGMAGGASAAGATAAGVTAEGASAAGVAAAGAAAADVAAAGGPVNPRAVPAIDFHASDVVWGERQLGDVRATLRKLDDGIGLTEALITGGSFSVSAKGEWRGKDTGLGRIIGTLTSTDVAATMKQLGYADVIEAKDGKMGFDLGWVGAPTTQALADARGEVEVALDKGQITGLKPGAGRVVGLASLAALPRRLALDFSDLTDKGFSFDTIRGTFNLHGGSAYTDNVLVKGPAAEIGLIGRVGLKSKDYDQTAVVTGNVGSTLPLAAFAAGPVVGGAVLLFTQVFKQPLRGLARGYYRITGGWDNPTVERIKSADAAAATAEAPK